MAKTDEDDALFQWFCEMGQRELAENIMTEARRIARQLDIECNK